MERVFGPRAKLSIFWRMLMTNSKFPVSDAKIIELALRMQRCGMRESDLVEEFVRGAGPGGQKINKASIAVYIKHLPSGLEVKCQESRSQALNRFLARRMLLEKIEQKLFKQASQKEQAVQKLRRQKRKRSKRAKDKMLADKKHHSQKKAGRRVRED